MRTKRSIKDSLKEYLNWCVGRLLLGGSRDDTVRDMVDAISDEIASGGGGVSQDQLDQTVKDITKSYGIADQTVLTSAEQYTDQKIADVVDGSPEALDTLYELAKALGDDPNFATTVMGLIGQKLPTTTFENFVANKAWTRDNLTKLSQLVNNINSIKAGTRVESMDVNLASISSYLEYDLFDANTTGTKPPGLTTGFLLTFSWDNGGWGAQIATSDGNVDGAIFLRTIKASESDKIWGPWVSLYNTANFNPDNYLNAKKGLISDLNTATGSGVYYFSTPGSDNTPENYGSLLVVATVDNGSPWINQFAFGTSNKIWHRQNINNAGWNSWTYLYDSSNFNPDSKFNNLENVNDSDNVVGNGYTITETGSSFSGPFLKWGKKDYMIEFFTGNNINDIRIRSMFNGVWGDSVKMLHSGNLGNATTSQAGLMSAADKTKLDGLSDQIKVVGQASSTYIFPGDPSELDSSSSSTHITSILGTASDFLDAFNNGKVFVSKTVTFSGVSVPSDITYNVLKSEDPDNPTIFQIIMSTVVWGHYIEITIDFENNEYQAISNTINGIIGVNNTGTTN